MPSGSNAGRNPIADGAFELLHRRRHVAVREDEARARRGPGTAPRSPPASRSRPGSTRRRPRVACPRRSRGSARSAPRRRRHRARAPASSSAGSKLGVASAHTLPTAARARETGSSVTSIPPVSTSAITAAISATRGCLRNVPSGRRSSRGKCSRYDSGSCSTSEYGGAMWQSVVIRRRSHRKLPERGR